MSIDESETMYADMAMQGIAANEHKELIRLQRENEREQVIYERDIRRLQKQQHDLQQAVDGTKEK